MAIPIVVTMAQAACHFHNGWNHCVNYIITVVPTNVTMPLTDILKCQLVIFTMVGTTVKIRLS